MHVMTVIDFLITSNDKSYRTQCSLIEYFAIYLGGRRPLQQRATTNFLFFFFFFFFFFFALFVTMQSLYAVSPLTQALHYNPENKTVSAIFSSEN